MEVVQIRKNKKQLSKHESSLKKFGKVLVHTLLWSFLNAMILGGIAAAIWTVIPTEMLDWGASKMNLIGYTSHCSFTPISTSSLLAMSGIAVLLTLPLRKSRHIGAGVFIGGSSGLAIGMLIGLDIIMFIGMGSGIGVGALLGVLIGMNRGASVVEEK